ncbi:MAG: hypothetical protein ACP5I3_10040 [Thermoproteus sp.]
MEELRKRLEELAAAGDKDAQFVLTRLVDGRIEFDDDLKMLLDQIMVQSGPERLEQLFGAYTDALADELFDKVKDVPLSLLAIALSKFLAKMAASIGPEIGELFIQAMCASLVAMSMKRQARLSQLGPFGRFCLSVVRT